MPLDIAELRRLAETATPGPENHAWIAAADPTTVLALLDRLAAVERERDEARRDLTAAEALLVVATGALCRCGKTWCIQSCTAERLVTYLATKERD